MIGFILEKLKEPSTWRGVAMIAGLIGYNVSPELLDTIIAAVTGAMALIEVIRKEQKPSAAALKAPEVFSEPQAGNAGTTYDPNTP